MRGHSGLTVALREKPQHLPLGLSAIVSGEGVLRVQSPQQVTWRGHSLRLVLGTFSTVSECGAERHLSLVLKSTAFLPDVDRSSIL